MYLNNSQAASQEPFVVGDESPTVRRSLYERGVVFAPNLSSLETKDNVKERKCVSCSRREKLLVLAVVLLLVLALVFIILYAREMAESEEPEERGPCMGPKCIDIASDLLRAINQSVDPCSDFYHYACGKWIADNPIPETKKSWSQFGLLYQRNEQIMRRLISSSAVREKYQDNEAVMKALDYYDSCLDEDKIEELDAKPLEALIKRFGSWNVTDPTWDENAWNFMDVFVNIHKNLSLSPLYNMYVGTDPKNSTQHVIKISQSGIGISKNTFFLNETHRRQVRDAYKAFMIGMAKELGAGYQAEALMTEVYQFEETLARNFVTSSRFLDTMSKKMRLQDLVEEVGKELKLTEFLQKMFEQTGYNITEDEPIITYSLDYLKNVSTIIESTPKRILANYMMWQVVFAFGSSLSKRFQKVYKKFNDAMFGGLDEEPRWQVCVGDVDGVMGMALGALFVDKTFRGESKESAETMIGNIRSVFLSNLEKQDWMDGATKDAARKKALAIKQNVGYPPYIMDKTLLAQRYKGLSVSKDKYFDNGLEASAFYNLRNYEKLGKPVDKSRWLMTPQTVNAYYSPYSNKIAFPAGILQKPFYDQSLPKFLNYGGIGFVVGHEITHGFDDQGRRYNSDGNLEKWWSNSSMAAFKRKSQCFVEQYSNYTFFGHSLNGKRSLGENIADNGGLRQSFQAYIDWKESNGEEQQLPGLDMSNEQLFFLGFAQNWCSAYREEGAKVRADFAVHSPAQWRVIGPLSNFDEFSKAYNCPVGSTMNPEKKCSIW